MRLRAAVRMGASRDLPLSLGRLRILLLHTLVRGRGAGVEGVLVDGCLVVVAALEGRGGERGRRREGREGEGKKIVR